MPQEGNGCEKRQWVLAALEAVSANQDVRVVVLTGAGRGFCAGARPQGVEAYHILEYVDDTLAIG